ncbi:class A beta-lactamase Bla1 [Streptomyces sodiiphilus]|uniref:Beta-lactamase n=1 Tax=Streptomyces sodiiphilus TaxID=226217 RepID=A0ABN2P318_9ACTN
MAPLSLARRVALRALGVLVLVPLAACGQDTAPPPAAPDSAQTAAPDHLAEEFERLEEKFEARLGVYVLDTGSGEEITHRADERFAYASTFKPFAAGIVLRDFFPDRIDDVITYTSEDLVPWSPVTEEHVEEGMSLRDLSEAAVRHSDNTATNLVFDALGGPEALGGELRELGDEVIRMNRYETELNEAVPGDTRDTSTPRALATTLEMFLLGDVLGDEEREILADWMLTNTTGANLIQAGMPDGWRVADKSGAGEYGTRNNIAVVWPEDGEPLVMAVLSSRDEQDAGYDDVLVAEAAAVVAGHLTS